MLGTAALIGRNKKSEFIMGMSMGCMVDLANKLFKGLMGVITGEATFIQAGVSPGLLGSTSTAGFLGAPSVGQYEDNLDLYVQCMGILIYETNVYQIYCQGL